MPEAGQQLNARGGLPLEKHVQTWTQATGEQLKMSRKDRHVPLPD